MHGTTFTDLSSMEILRCAQYDWLNLWFSLRERKAFSASKYFEVCFYEFPKISIFQPEEHSDEESPDGTAQSDRQPPHFSNQETFPGRKSGLRYQDLMEEIKTFTEEIEHSRPPVSRGEMWLELVSTLILALATFATAWSGYQAGLWSNQSSTLFNQAAIKRVESSRISTLAGQFATLDALAFNDWLKASHQGDSELAQAITERFRGEFRQVFEKWLDNKEIEQQASAPNPFALAEYEREAVQESQKLEEQAVELFRRAMEANQYNNAYLLNTVILASVLFFAGISMRLYWLPARITILVLAAAMLAWGIVKITALPVASG